MTSYFILLALIPASALIMEDVFPPRLEECYLEKADKNITQYDVQKSCLESFLEHMYNNKSSIGLRTDAFDWLDSLGRKLHNRLRRQTRYRLRVRKEIRTLSENEFQNFIDAVKALKSDTVSLLVTMVTISKVRLFYNFSSFNLLDKYQN